MEVQVPEVPFYFRIRSQNDQGIIYKAIEKVGESYTCQGTRQGGVVDGKIVWVLSNYTDEMPPQSISKIIQLRKIPKKQTDTIIDTNHLEPALKQMTLFEDNTGYLFERGDVRSRNQTDVRSRNQTDVRSRNRYDANERSRNRYGRNASRSVSRRSASRRSARRK